MKGLTKTYSASFRRRGQPALRGVDLALPAGCAFGLIGANGAGKTTFIKSLLGIVRPTGGTVRVLGGNPEDPAVRARLGYLPERLHLPAAATPRGFLASVAALKRLRLPDAALDALVARVGLADAAGRKLGTFSKGMRQRAGLAAALLGAPELLILDEPTDGIDPMGRIEIRAILREELARGVTLFLNSHLLAETERVCTRFGILHAGALIRDGSLEQLQAEQRRWKLRFAPGADAHRLLAAGLLPLEQQWQFAGGDVAALNAALDRARVSGALLLELIPELSDLEAVLTQTLRASA